MTLSEAMRIAVEVLRAHSIGPAGVFLTAANILESYLCEDCAGMGTYEQGTGTPLYATECGICHGTGLAAEPATEELVEAVARSVAVTSAELTEWAESCDMCQAFRRYREGH